MYFGFKMYIILLLLHSTDFATRAFQRVGERKM